MTERLEIKAALSVDDAGEISGIAWPFGSPDSVGDVIEKGAFAASPDRLPMLFSHDQTQVIGVWDSLTETSAGLQVKGRLLVDDVERAREVRAMVRSGAVNGLSIGFVTKSAKPRRIGRTISALDLREISIVAVPCHPGAQITSIKAADGTAPNKENARMEDELETLPEVKADPVIEKKELIDLKARMDRLEAKSKRLTGTNDNTPSAENDNVEMKAFISFARRGVERMDQKAAAALVVSTEAQGGYLAPEAFGSEILKSIVEFSPVRSYARVMSVVSEAIKVPRKLTGTAATWVGETDDRDQSDMTFEQVTLAPYELATYVDVSTQLLEDNAYNLEGELASDLGEAFGKTEATAFVSGNGTGKPKGLLTASGIAEIKTGNAATLGTDPAATIIGMFHSVPSIVAQNGVWLMNRTTLGALRVLKDATGRFIMLDPITAGAPVTLLGRPVVEMVDMPNVAANTYPIMFGDLSGYRIIDRVGLSVLRDPYSQATKGTVRFHARKRVGGDVTNPDRFVKLKVAA
jgi:HK97 family phage major capsid protein/HK97 family phage prohead protease